MSATVASGSWTARVRVGGKGAAHAMVWDAERAKRHAVGCGRASEPAYGQPTCPAGHGTGGETRKTPDTVPIWSHVGCCTVLRAAGQPRTAACRVLAACYGSGQAELRHAGRFLLPHGPLGDMPSGATRNEAMHAIPPLYPFWIVCRHVERVDVCRMAPVTGEDLIMCHARPCPGACRMLGIEAGWPEA